jgi:nucleoside 2-deoxyribosyltransferase
MDVYFSGSITGGRDREGIYLVIVEILEELGCTVLSEHVARPKLLAAKFAGSAEETYTQDMQWLEASQAVVAEVSTPSHGVCYEIGHALAVGKPVLCLYDEDATVTRMILGNTHPNIVVRGYTDILSLRAAVEGFISAQEAASTLKGHEGDP